MVLGTTAKRALSSEMVWSRTVARSSLDIDGSLKVGRLAMWVDARATNELARSLPREQPHERQQKGGRRCGSG
jgi:hypothetical protein